MHIIGFNAMKALGMVQNVLSYAKTRLTNAKQAFSLLLNAFFSKNDVRCAKTRYFRAKKTRFMHITGFKRSESTENDANALNYAKLGYLTLNKHFPAFKRVFQQKRR